MRWSNFLAVVLCSAFGLSSATPEQQLTPTPTPQASPSPNSKAQPNAPEFLVVIDPSHGGFDKGADFGGKLLEKDITLKLGRELKRELEEHGIACRMLRDSDVDIALDRRAEITNEQHAGIYIALHASKLGRELRVYSPLLAEQQQPLGRFLPWESAQAEALERSKAAAQAVASELRKKDLPVATLGIPLRPLNNIAAPAIAIELAPAGDLQSLEDPKRYDAVASAVVAVATEMRGQMGAHP